MPSADADATKTPVSPTGSNVIAVPRIAGDLGGDRVADASATTLTEPMQEADEHLLEGSSLHHSIVVMEAKIKNQDRVTKELKGQEGGLKKSRDGLNAKLLKIMTPKLKAARSRLQHEKASIKNFEKEVKEMNATREKLEAAASEKVKEAETAFKALQKADAALAKAKMLAQTLRTSMRPRGARLRKKLRCCVMRRCSSKESRRSQCACANVLKNRKSP